MKERETFPGKTYAVTSPNGCLVTKLDGNPILTLKPGIQDYFVAPAGKALLTDDEADVTESFEGIHTVALKAETEANKAMRSAMDSATQAATSATQAAESAAQLGDAALKSADNTFAGNNIFSGAINGVPAWMGTNFLSTALKGCVMTETELKQLIPADIETWADYPQPNGSTDVSLDTNHWKKLKRIFFTVDFDAWYTFRISRKSGKWEEEVYLIKGKERYVRRVVITGKKGTVIAPELNHSTSGYNVAVIDTDYSKSPEELSIYAPKCTGKLTLASIHALGPLPNLKALRVLGANVFTNVDVRYDSPNQVLSTRAGFPKAKTINIKGMQLNKESVLPILNNLLPYDSATMTAVPTLTICMHTDLQADEEVQAALALASTAVEDGGKGWQVTTQWNGTATASTFALRPTPAPPVYVKATPDVHGGYVDATNTRYTVDWGHEVHSPDGREPEELGYALFDSLDEALTEWGLTEYMVIPGEDLTEQTEQ